MATALFAPKTRHKRGTIKTVMSGVTGNISVASISSPSPVTEGAPITFNVQLTSAVPSPDAVLFVLAGSGANPAVAGTNYNISVSCTNGVVQAGAYLAIPANVSAFDLTVTTLSSGGFYPATREISLTLDGTITKTANINSIPATEYVIPEAVGRVVPADFIGMHRGASYVTSFPTTDSVPNFDTLQYGAARSHDAGRTSPAESLFWFDIETSAGVYNTTQLDAAVLEHDARGQAFMLCVYGTPAFYATGKNIRDASKNSSAVALTTGISTQYYPATNNLTCYSCITAGATGASVPTFLTQAEIKAGTSLTWAAGTVTALCPSAHTYTSGDVIYIEPQSLWSAIGAVTITVTGANTYTFALAGDPGAGTPSFVMTKTFLDGTVRWLPRRLPQDGYYRFGGKNPAMLSGVTSFMTWLINRYNKVSAFNPTGKRYIKYIEWGNEPCNFENGEGFYNGPYSMLADEMWTARSVIKSLDAGTLFFGCGFTYFIHPGSPPSDVNAYDQFDAFCQALGTTTGKYGWETLADGMTYHVYGGTNLVESRNILTSAGLGARMFRSKMTAYGIPTTAKLMISEYGQYVQTPDITVYNGMSAADRAMLMEMRLAFMACFLDAAYLYKYHTGYPVESGAYCGQLFYDTTGARLGLNNAATNIVGKTIDNASYYSDDTLRVRIAGVDHWYYAPPTTPY